MGERISIKFRLHTDGPEVSRIAIGMMRLRDWNMSRAETREMIERCMEFGVTSFDHADIYGDYGCEALFGDALAGAPSMRGKMQLVTKCGIVLASENNPDCKVKHYCTSRQHILASVESSLKKLRTDYIDLLLIHRPDPLMDPDEVASAFTSLRDLGKVLFFGVSNFSVSQFEMLQSRLPFPLVTNQIECSVLETGAFEDGTIDFCQRLDIAPMAWSPLGGGALFSGKTKQIQRVRKELRVICDSMGIDSIDKLAIAWILKHPSRMVPVIGTGKIEHIENALGAMEIDLSRECWFRILRESRGRDVP